MQQETKENVVRKDLVIAGFAATALLGLGLAALSPGATPKRVIFGDCPKTPALVRAQCGSVRVPLDRANPGLGTTRVAFALIRRRNAQRPSLGTIVPNP